jgi:hypothetical protein
MQVSTGADSLGNVILPRVSLLPLPPVFGDRSPEWTAMSSSWRAAARQLNITALTQFDAQLQEAIRLDLGPKILLPAILNRSPKDVEEGWLTKDGRFKGTYFNDAKRIAIEWILDEWPSYMRLSGIHLWGTLTMANLMDNEDREQVWKALNVVSPLTWRYAPEYAPFTTTYPLAYFEERLPSRKNAYYVLVRYASMVILMFGIVSAIRALIRLRTNREIPRGILAIAFAVGWSIAHSIPAGLLVFPEHRYTYANMLMMLSGGAAWFAYLGTNAIAPRKEGNARLGRCDSSQMIT